MHESSLDALTRLQTNCVSLDTVMCKLSLLGGEPSGSQGFVWKNKYADNGHANSDYTLYDKKPNQEVLELSLHLINTLV